MKIAVLIKQVPDPEGPRDAFCINHDELRVDPQGIPPVLSLFDENALEAALRLKDSLQGQARIMVITMGKRISNAVMLKALAAGADEMVKIEHESLALPSLDSTAIAAILAAVIRKLAPIDLIFTGRQSADWNASQTGIRLGGLLGLPVITFTRKVTLKDGSLHVEQVLPNGFQTVRCALPAVVVVGNEAGELRYPTMIERREAKNKPIHTWQWDDGHDHYLNDNKVRLKQLFTPSFERGSCTFIERGPEAGRRLAQQLIDNKIL